MRKIVLCLLFCIVCAPLFGQSSQVAQVSGRVLDPSGAIVPGAHINITNGNTNAVRTTESSADGAYARTKLPTGTYRLSVIMNSFSSYVQTGIILDVDAHPEINVTLEVGQVHHREAFIGGYEQFWDMAEKANVESVMQVHPNTNMNLLARTKYVSEDYPPSKNPLLYGAERTYRYIEIVRTCTQARMEG